MIFNFQSFSVGGYALIFQEHNRGALAISSVWTPRSMDYELVCDTPDSLRDENRYLERVFHKNNYNADFITVKPDVDGNIANFRRTIGI